MESRYYEYYQRFYYEIKKFIADFDINYPHPLIPKLDFPEIELLALLPEKNEFGNLYNGKFHTIFTNIDLGFLIAEWLNESNNNSYAAQLAKYFHKYFVSKKGLEFKVNSLRTSITANSNLPPINPSYNLHEAKIFIANLINTAVKKNEFQKL
jgi:hypothetical protein